jgi:hypothetical protein
MRASSHRKKSSRSDSSQTQNSDALTLYRPSNSFPFPEVRGKTVVEVYVITDSDQRSVTVRFADNTELIIDIEPSVSFTADYYDWKTGKQCVIKHWPRVRTS